MKTYYAGLVFMQLCIYYFCGIRRIDILAEHLVPRGVVDIFDGLKWTTGEARIFTPPVDFPPISSFFMFTVCWLYFCNLCVSDIDSVIK